MRLAWFSPMPPVRSGIAACSAGLVRALRAEHRIDVFVDEPVAHAARDHAGDGAGGVRHSPHSAHEFVWRHARVPYDLMVYQLGNSSHHDYLWPYLFRYPGLAVLHDAHLHHARAAVLLRQGRRDDYRREFAASVPHASPDAAELAVAGFDSALHYEWPFVDLVVAASRVTAVHSTVVRDELAERHPGREVAHVRLGHGTPLTSAESASRGAAARARLGIPPGAVLFGCYGGLTPEKRLPQVFRAFEAILPDVPAAWLLLAGPEALHYDVRADTAQRGISERVTVTGYIEQEDLLTDCVAACDVALNLRWPTAREISGPWLRCLAAGKPSIVIDLAHTADVPALDPRTWTRLGDAGGAPVAVALDILDEDHSLRLAMRRLAGDARLREGLGAAARLYWAAHHAEEQMFADYRRVIPQAAAAGAPQPPLPPHLLADGSASVRRLLEPFGVPVPWSKI